MYDVPMRSMPDLSPHRNVSAFAVELTHNGGTGARPGKDGLSATAYPSGVWGSQVEITESVAPLLVHRRELRRGSGGAGKYRGGLGQTLEIENAEGAPSAFFLSFERVKYPARGRAGGADGARGIVTLSSGETLSGKGEFALLPGERLICEADYTLTDTDLTTGNGAPLEPGFVKNTATMSSNELADQTDSEICLLYTSDAADE